MKKALLLVGPESSGTRWMASVLSKHPLILGPTGTHDDVLDLSWSEHKPIPKLRGHEAILTRRSLPHSIRPGASGRYMIFADLDAFHMLCDEAKLGLVLLITTRSPAAHLASWTSTRASALGDWQRATRQYQAAYKHVFDFILRKHVAFMMISLEGMVLDGSEYVNGIYRLLGLPDHEVRVNGREDVNFPRYD